MQITYRYYKFPTKDLAPKPEQWPSEVSYFEVGTLYNNDAIINEQGIVVKPPTAKTGWFVNVCYNSNPLIKLDFIQEFEINVQTPNYLWLGQNS